MSDLEKNLQEQVRVYETLLHDICKFTSSNVDNPAFAHLIDIVSYWSKAHTAYGNLAETERKKIIKYWFGEMEYQVWNDSAHTSRVDTEYKRRYNSTSAANDPRE